MDGVEESVELFEDTRSEDFRSLHSGKSLGYWPVITTILLAYLTRSMIDMVDVLQPITTLMFSTAPRFTAGVVLSFTVSNDQFWCVLEGVSFPQMNPNAGVPAWISSLLSCCMGLCCVPGM